jgi:catechol 2,3-dioxygenase-like lactoylglutathione lyase family enzyme
VTLALSHVTISVTDLARSERFYAEALGFSRIYAGEPEAAFKALLERTESRSLAMVSMQSGDFRIELLKIDPTDGALSAPPTLGLRHIAVRVDDLQAAAERISRAGGRALAGTETSAGGGRFVMCADPDGVRLLLIETPSS